MDIEAERSADLRILDEIIEKIRNRLAALGAGDDHGDPPDEEEVGKLHDRLLRYLQRRSRMLGYDKKPSAETKQAPGTIASVTSRLQLVKSPGKRGKKA